MKLYKKVLLIVTGALLITTQACKDDTTNTPGGNNSLNDCVLSSTTSSDGDNYEFTFTNGKMTKIVDSYQSGTDTYNVEYSGDQITKITTETEVYTLIYNGSNLTKVEYRDEGELLGYMNVTSSGGKISKIVLYEVDGMDEEIVESYDYSYNGNNASKVVNSFDSDGDGSLDFVITFNMTKWDDKINPYYGSPLWILEIDNPLYISQNNPVEGSLVVATETTTYNVTYTYNSANLPTQMVTKLNNSSSTVNFTYDCK